MDQICSISGHTLIYPRMPQLHKSQNNHLGTVKIKNYTHPFQYGKSIPGQVQWMFATNVIRDDKRLLSHHHCTFDYSERSPIHFRSIEVPTMNLHT